MGGFANYTGDIQQKRFTLNQANAVITGGATFNVTDQLALRSDYSFTRLQADDKYNKPALAVRNLNFKTLIQELNLMGEYDILNLNEHPLTPYLFAGVGVFKFSPYTVDPAGTKIFLIGLSTEGQGLHEYPDRKIYKKTQLNIPFGGGLKYALSDDIHVGFEIGIRKLFTDYIDDVSTTYVDPNILAVAKGQQAADYAFRGDELKPPVAFPGAGATRGNSKINDYYYYGQFRLSFRMPWFDKGGSNRVKGNGKGLGCPSWHLKL